MRLSNDGAPAARPSPPPAMGVRRPWESIPTDLRATIEARLGGQVVTAVTQPGGFSPGVAARLTSAGGQRAFVKAVGPEPNPDSPDIHRAEARIAAALPAATPAPRMLASFDQAGWVALLFEDVEGTMPAQPWVPAELDRVLAALTDLAVSLTPAPIEAPSAAAQFDRAFRGWRGLAEAFRRGDALDDLDPWIRRRLPDLATLEAEWGDAVQGATLVHADIRADNLLLTPDRVLVVDWPWACVAAPWFDLLATLPSVRMQGGPPCETLFADHPVARDADPAAVTSVVAAVTGMLVEHARRPSPPGLPTLRAFQHAQGAAGLEWLRTRTGWD